MKHRCSADTDLYDIIWICEQSGWCVYDAVGHSYVLYIRFCPFLWRGVKMIKKFLLLPILVSWAFAQSPHVDTMDYCGLGHHKDKPCRCVDHTNQIQNDWVFRCLGEHPSWDETRCVREMPQEVKDHCQAIEHYGNWGDESHPMPQQCSMACRRGHCKCQEGPMCHIGHQPAEDGK